MKTSSRIIKELFIILITFTILNFGTVSQEDANGEAGVIFCSDYINDNKPTEATKDTNIMSILLYSAIAIGVLFAISGMLDSTEKRHKKAMARLKKSIKKTKIIDSSHIATASSRTSTTSAMGRAIVGSAIAGSLGSIVGIATAKQQTTVSEKHTATFMVYYKNGTRYHETVENESEKYELYMNKLELGYAYHTDMVRVYTSTCHLFKNKSKPYTSH